LTIVRPYLIVSKTKDKIFEEALKPIAIRMMKLNPQAEATLFSTELVHSLSWLGSLFVTTSVRIASFVRKQE
jgi:hypothetical protein